MNCIFLGGLFFFWFGLEFAIATAIANKFYIDHRSVDHKEILLGFLLCFFAACSVFPGI